MLNSFLQKIRTEATDKFHREAKSAKNKTKIKYIYRRWKEYLQQMNERIQRIGMTERLRK